MKMALVTPNFETLRTTGEKYKCREGKIEKEADYRSPLITTLQYGSPDYTATVEDWYIFTP
jgi:hypothetical protein